MKLLKTLLCTGALIIGLNQNSMAASTDDFTVFEKSADVKLTKVQFKNRFGITL